MRDLQEEGRSERRVTEIGKEESGEEGNSVNWTT